MRIKNKRHASIVGSIRSGHSPYFIGCRFIHGFTRSHYAYTRQGVLDIQPLIENIKRK